MKPVIIISISVGISLLAVFGVAVLLVGNPTVVTKESFQEPEPDQENPTTIEFPTIEFPTEQMQLENPTFPTIEQLENRNYRTTDNLALTSEKCKAFTIEFYNILQQNKSGYGEQIDFASMSKNEIVRVAELTTIIQDCEGVISEKDLVDYMVETGQITQEMRLEWGK